MLFKPGTMTTISKMANLRLAILGPSGGGKGTQAKLLANDFGWRHLSVGQLLREEEKKNTRVGKQLRRYVDKGLLVPDDLMLTILFAALEKITAAGFILDGAPRTLNQAQKIDKFLQNHRTPLDLVILLEVPDGVIINRRRRMMARGEKFQPGRRDNREDILRRRLDFYRRNIGGLKGYYQKQGILMPIDGARPVDVINRDLEAALRVRFDEGR